MRSYSIPILLAGLIMASAGDVEAQRTGNREMHERINALRNRLQNYQLERVREEPRKALVIEEKETVEVKYEQLVEEFEARKDVAVTVLFHDEDFAKNQMTENTPATVDEETVAVVAAVADPDIDNSAVDKPAAKAAVSTERTTVLADAARQLEHERAQRQEKYEALRRRVQMATRRVHDQAREINSMVAVVP
jgi:hypothetical protein